MSSSRKNVQMYPDYNRCCVDEFKDDFLVLKLFTSIIKLNHIVYEIMVEGSLIIQKKMFYFRGPRRSSGGGTIENLVEDVIVNFADYARSGGSPV